MSVKITQTNPGMLERFKNVLRAAGGHVAVGYPANAAGVAAPHYPTAQSGAYRSRKDRSKPMRPPLGSGPSIAQVAAWNNKTRPFFTAAVKAMNKEWKKMLKKALPSVYAGRMKWEKLLNAGGIMGVDKVRKSITQGAWKQNSPMTQRVKGSSKPLIDSGDMRKYPTYVVKK